MIVSEIQDRIGNEKPGVDLEQMVKLLLFHSTNMHQSVLCFI